jgi:ABC-type uncharacterized transport system fused permease/ATPase subunit
MAKKDDSLNAPLWKMWYLLRPSWKQLFGEEREMLYMTFLNIMRAAELRLTTSVVKIMDATLASRSLGDFKKGMMYSFGVAIVGSWLRIIYGYFQARLTWKWKNKMTHKLHDMYFKGINYYLIGEGGGAAGKKLSDADSRMTQDLNTVVNAFSQTFNTSTFLLSAGFFYTYEVRLPANLRGTTVRRGSIWSKHSRPAEADRPCGRSTASSTGSTPSLRTSISASPT